MTQTKLTTIGLKVDSTMAESTIQKALNQSKSLRKDIDDNTAQIFDTDKKTDQVKKKVESTQMSARQTWSYVNQLSTMFLNNLEKIAGGSEKTAWIQRSLATASVVQQEFAIKRLIMESVAAYSTGNIATGSMLAAIAATMQISAASAYTTRLQSINTESEASRIRQMIESYRS